MRSRALLSAMVIGGAIASLKPVTQALAMRGTAAAPRAFVVEGPSSQRSGNQAAPTPRDLG